MTTMIYVRHGESQATVNRTIGGPRSCSGLSPLGIQQVERLRDRWLSTPEFHADLLISSHFPRARETAEILAPALGGLEVTIDEGFGEHDPGPECDGMPVQEFYDTYGTAGWSSDPYGVTFPGGETLAQLHYRVGEAVRRTTQQHPDATIVVACHGGVIDAVLRHAMRAPATDLFQLHTLNASITELRQVDPYKWRLRRYGDSAHLVGLPASSLA